MKAVFRIVKGEQKGDGFELLPGKAITVGRSKHAGFVIPESGVSRVHCQFTHDGKRVILTDLRSTNGTFVNNRRVKSAPIEDGDQIRVGTTVLLFRLVSPEQPSPPVRRREEAKPKEKPAELKSGSVIAGCRLTEELKWRGNTVVFRAVQEAIGRDVTLKVLANSSDASEAEIERFLGPAKTAGRLNHPNIIQIHGAGKDAGYYYIIEEFITGKDIGAVMKKAEQVEPLPAALAIEVAVKIAEVLDYAHSCGVMHGDIRPKTVMVCRTSKTLPTPRSLETLGTLKLVDFSPFGYMLGADAKERTAAFGHPGVHGYCSPEQLDESGKVDERTDIYSLGALLYFMLTGRSPFHQKTSEGLVSAISKGRTIPIRDLNPGVPLSLCEIVSKAMAVEPAERYQSAREMQDALRELLSFGG